MARRMGGGGDGGTPKQGEPRIPTAPLPREEESGPVHASPGRRGLRLRHRGLDARPRRDGHPESRTGPVPSRARLVCPPDHGLLLPEARTASEGAGRRGSPSLGSGRLAPHPKKGRRTRARLSFWDESGVSDRPTVRKTWALRGRTPLVRSAGHWRTRSVVGVIRCAIEGTHPALLLRIVRGAVRSLDVIRVLKELRRHTRGKVILLWDRLASHRSREVRAFLRVQRSWLTVEEFPPYAPELNPPEYLWAALKGKDLANTCPDTLRDLDGRIRNGARRLRRHPDILRGCLKASTLFGAKASR